MTEQQTPLLPYQESFIDFLLETEALLFGEFTLKSGRKAPYFINTGKFCTGELISGLGAFYAQHIIEQKLTGADTLFGPAYKGIPLCVATAHSLAVDHRLNFGFTFDRKEAKDHGDKGNLVGTPLQAGMKAIIVEDVVTAGTTIREIVPQLREKFGVRIDNIVIAVNRCEKGKDERSAVAELEETLQLHIKPLVTIYDVLSYLTKDDKDGFRLDSNVQQAVEQYLEEYGA